MSKISSSMATRRNPQDLWEFMAHQEFNVKGCSLTKTESLTDNSKTTNSVVELSRSPGKRMEQSVEVEMWNWVSNQVSSELGDPSQLRGQVPGEEDPGILQENTPSRWVHSHVLLCLWGLQKFLCDGSFKCIENGVSPHRSKLF